MTISELDPSKTGTLDELRKAGYKVFISHKRLIGELWDNERVANFDPSDKEVFASRHEIQTSDLDFVLDVNSNGGVTTVSIYKDEHLLGTGVAYCCLKDPFNKRRGLTIALGRALKSMK